MIHRPRSGRPLTGDVSVPGDKSISHRAVIVAALAPGRSRIKGLNSGADVAATSRCVAALGARLSDGDDGGALVVQGKGFRGLSEPAEVLDAGNSGTTLRLLTGVCAAVPGLHVLTGDASLRSRPMGRIAEPLRAMGAVIDGRDDGGLAPIVVRGGPLRGASHDLPVASAQVKSALLLAGLAATGTTRVVEPEASRDHTERMLLAAGVPVERDGLAAWVTGPLAPGPLEVAVPGDVSSATYLVVAALLIPGSDVTITGVGLNPTRTAALDVLVEMGADIEVSVEGAEAGEPIGSIRARASELHAVEVGAEAVPNLIDEIPILAVAATHATGTTVIRGASELRVKESDRIAGVADGLRTLGAPVEELPDGLVVTGPTRLSHGEVDSRGDHRIALSFAVAGLAANERVRVRSWRCVDTSFPHFLETVAAARGARR